MNGKVSPPAWFISQPLSSASLAMISKANQSSPPVSVHT
jgi:hypothetical protein